MNAKRRKAISELVTKLDAIVSELTDIIQEENDYYDNMPDSLRDGEKGDKAQEAINQLEEAMTNAESAKDALENIE